MKKGFTLIELLVVVLIIGILAAIAVPMYQKAVLKSRFAALMPIVKAMNDSNEAYYLEHGQYASNPQDLPVQGQVEYPAGTTVEFGSNLEHAYVLAGNSDARNNYIMYQKHSENFPGEIHCEALEGDELAQSICESYGTNNIGTILTNGYTTYVIQGSGAGFPPGYNALLAKVDCTAAEALGFTCEYNIDEENNTATKTICTPEMFTGNKVCRSRTYNEDGSYTSFTYETRNDRCQSYMRIAGYNANGNQTSDVYCKTANCRTCTETIAGNSPTYYTYDENGNKLTQRQCLGVTADGSCTSYYGWGSGVNYDYKYDENGNQIFSGKCSSMGSDGICTSYDQSYTTYYTYDENGKLTESTYCGHYTAVKCSYLYHATYTNDENGRQTSVLTCRLNGDDNCAQYVSRTEYTYDANGNKISQRYCDFPNGENNSCSTYGRGYDYVYDANGNQTSYRSCGSFAADGSCVQYNNRTDYTYDANGNQTSSRYCSSIAADGSCSTYGTSYDYVYDANGNQTSQRSCSSVAADGSCSTYNYGVDYTYDENGKPIIYLQCTGDNVNPATGECISYNIKSSLYAK